MGDTTTETLLALKRRTLQNFRDIVAVLEMQITQLGEAYVAPGKILALENTKRNIALIQEEIVELEAEAGDKGNDPLPNSGRMSYTDALLDLRLGQTRIAANQAVTEGKIDAVLRQVSSNTLRLDAIEGYLRAAGSVRFTGGTG